MPDIETDPRSPLLSNAELSEILHCVSPGLERCLDESTPGCPSCERHDQIRREVQRVLDARGVR